MKTMILTIAMMGFVCGGFAQSKHVNKTVHQKTTLVKPVYTYKKNGVTIREKPGQIKNNSDLISFSSEGTFEDAYPKLAPKLASK